MNVFKIIYAKNEIISCVLLLHPIEFEGPYYYEQEKGKLIYALVKAEHEEEAITRGHTVIREVIEKTFGKDFVN